MPEGWIVEGEDQLRVSCRRMLSSQAFGITKQELESFKDTKQTAEALIDARRKSNPLLVTDLARKDG